MSPLSLMSDVPIYTYIASLQHGILLLSQQQQVKLLLLCGLKHVVIHIQHRYQA